MHEVSTTFKKENKKYKKQKIDFYLSSLVDIDQLISNNILLTWLYRYVTRANVSFFDLTTRLGLGSRTEHSCA